MGFNNSGTVEIQSGTLLCNGSFANNGTVQLSAGTTHGMAGGGSASGPFTAPATALVEWTGGTFTLNAGAQLNGAGLYRINLATVTANPNLLVENLDLINGTLSGAGIVTVSKGMNWSGGTMSGSGRTIIPAGATLNAAVPSSVGLTSRTLEIAGTVLWTGAGFIGVTGSAVITNQPGALFLVQNAAGIGGGIANGRLDNAGTFRKSVSAGITAVASGMSFNNFGVVEIQTGTLDLGGGGTHSGSFDVPAGTALILSGGTHAANGSSSITGAGQFTVSGGTANLAGLVNVSGSNTFSGGTANLNGNYICTNNTVTISGSGTANFSGTGLVSPAVLNLSNGTLDGTGTVTINSGMNWTGGNMSGSGRTIIAAGVTLNVANPFLVILASRTLENGGTILWTGAGVIALNSGAVITNRAGALFHAQNAVGLGGGIANGRLDNAGTFRKSATAGTTTVSSGMSFNNAGTVEIQTGTLLCSGSFNNSGAVNLSSGTTNRLAAGGSASGTFTAPATTLVEWTGGTFTLNAGAQLNGAGLYKLNGGIVTANASLTVENLDLVLGSSTLGGTGTMTIANVMNWPAGTMSGGGRTIIAAGATLNIAPPSSVSLNPRTLENGGTVLWTGTGNNFILGSGVITNRAGGLFHAQNTAAFFFGGGGCRFDNAGTFRKSANAGTTTVPSGVSFTNSGTVDIRSGILAANGGYVSSSNALLNCALGGTTAGTGHGQLQVAGAVTLNGALSVDLTNGFSPALNDSFTVLTAGTRNSTFSNFSYPSNVVTMQLSNSPTSVIVRVTDVFTAIPPPMLFPPEISGTNFKLTWTAVSNTTYRVEFNPNLTPSNWTALPGDVIGVSNTASKLDALTPSNRLYRVRVVP